MMVCAGVVETVSKGKRQYAKQTNEMEPIEMGLNPKKIMPKTKAKKVEREDLSPHARSR